MEHKALLGDIAKFLRSKNAGPFKLTIDIFFHKREDYKKICSLGILNKEVVSELYNLKNPDTVSIVEFDPVSAIKITFPRRIPSGNVGDPDVYGAQQYAPIYDLAVPWG